MTLDEAKNRLYTISGASPFGDVKEACLLGILAIEYAEEHGFKENTLDELQEKGTKDGQSIHK